MSDLLNNLTVQYAPKKPAGTTTTPIPMIKLDLNTQNKIKPLDAKGKMLKSRIIGSPIEYTKDIAKDVVNIKNGMTGKANDHELGRMNDLAMKLGSLGLAGYLFVKNPLKLKKTMEFVGFGTFFASMALWPKLAIQAPLRALTGVDIHQKYQDSYGRKKMFFQDPQYVPWDLVNKEDLNKMGDRLNISKDAPNREALIKEKAQKIAVQGNTLWMLTAGFATPLMSALSCNVAEKFILDAQEKSSLKETQKMIENPLSYVESFKNKEAEKIFNTFIAAHGEEQLTPDLIDGLTKTLGLDKDFLTNKAIKEEITRLNVPTIKPLNSTFSQTLFNQNENLFTKNNINLEKLTSYISSKGEKFTVTNKNLAGFADDLAKFIAENGEELSVTDIKAIKNNFKNNIPEIIKAISTPTLNDIKAPMEKLFNLMNDYSAQRKVIDKYIDARIGDKAETFIANQWGRVNKKFLKTLGISNKELAKIKAGNGDSTRLIMKHLTKLAQSDDKQYRIAIRMLTQQIAKYDDILNEEFCSNIEKNVDRVFNQAGATFRENEFENLAKRILGYDLNNGATQDIAGSSKNYIKGYARDRVLGARASFYRMLQTIDLFKRFEDGTLNKQLNFITGNLPEELKDYDIDQIIKIFKDGDHQLGDNDEVVNEQLAKIFGKPIKNELEKPFQESIKSVNKGTSYYVEQQLKDFVNGAQSYEQLSKNIKECLKFETAETAQKITKSALELAEERRSWYSLGSMMDQFKGCGDVTKKSIIDKAIEACKKTILTSKITDHTEKLNDVQSRTYQAIMHLLFGSKVDTSTAEVLESSSDSLRSNFRAYRERFIDKIGNWQYWYKSSHLMDAPTNSLNGTERHLLVGSTITDMASKTAENLYNTNKWLKIFGGMMIGLVAVTLAVQPLFGKIKKESNYSGGQK